MLYQNVYEYGWHLAVSINNQLTLGVFLNFLDVKGTWVVGRAVSATVLCSVGWNGMKLLLLCNCCLSMSLYMIFKKVAQYI